MWIRPIFCNAKFMQTTPVTNFIPDWGSGKSLESVDPSGRNLHWNTAWSAPPVDITRFLSWENLTLVTWAECPIYFLNLAPELKKKESWLAYYSVLLPDFFHCICLFYTYNFQLHWNQISYKTKWCKYFTGHSK